MTQEQKAKAYDEALERARKVHRNYKNLFPEDSYSEDIEEIFPQLRESEDERIRKAIIHYILYETKGTISEATEHTWVKWLEKQKEQKQTDLPAGFYYIDLDGNKYYSKEFRYGDMKVKVGEQKPVDKQDYSGLNDLERAILRGFLCAGVENVPVGIIKDTAAECIGFLALIEQKPAWSEEDEENIDSLVIILHKALSKGISCEEEVLDLTDWLKSLRPSWKPSEEQLNALNFAITYFMHETNYKNPTELRDLYEQLKKL